MKNLALLLSISLLFVFGSCQQEKSASTAPDAKKDPSAHLAKAKAASTNPDAANATGGKVNWINITDLESKMKTDKRPVLVDLYTDWCGWCKRMDKATFQHPQVADYVNDNFWAVKFNAETKDDINFKGDTYKFVQSGRRGSNMLSRKLILGDAPSGRMGYPTIAFLDENMDRINAFPGYKDAHNFDEIAHYIKEGKYKDQTLAQYQQTFDSPIPPAPPRKSSNKRKPNANAKKAVQGQKGQSIQVQGQNGAKTITITPDMIQNGKINIGPDQMKQMQQQQQQGK